MELNVNPNLIYNIVQKARICHGREFLGFPELTPNIRNDFDWMQLLTDHSSDYTYQDAVDSINTLDPSQQATLVAIMYLGRGDYDVSEWEQAVNEAQDIWTNKTGEYLLSRPLVADYLEEGLLQLGCRPDH